jgi:hypothetical protein
MWFKGFVGGLIQKRSDQETNESDEMMLSRSRCIYHDEETDWSLLGGKRDCEKGQGFVGPAAERIDFASAH